MIQTERMILDEIRQLFDDLDKATYGDYKANGHVIPPNASRFYYTTKRLYEQVDILVKDYNPNYVSPSDYMYIRFSKNNLTSFGRTKRLQKVEWSRTRMGVGKISHEIIRNIWLHFHVL